MIAVFKRELRNYFLTPIGYVFMGVFLLVGGIFFTINNMMSGVSDLEGMFSMLNILFMVIVPLLTMRLLSEERRTKTDQLLLTAPVTIWAVVLGKFLAASMVLVISLLGTLSYVAVIAIYSVPYWGLILSNYIGFLLMGAGYIAVGVLMSALTESQLTAAVLTFGVNLLLWLLESIGPSLNVPFLPWLPQALGGLSLYRRYYSLTSGIISIADILYFVSFVGILLFLTVRVIDKRRWSEA